ncbi:MAG TPA: glycosyltransferase family 4 protein [Bacteroidota bacterium]|nr:glycosyltransferase family 4 protein [Bacteroidota bacterium]
MNIAVFHNLPTGGALRALYGHIKCLKQAGHNVDVFLPSTGEQKFFQLDQLVRRFVVLPVRTTPLGIAASITKYVPPLPGFAISLSDLENVQKQLAQAINNGNYDVVFVEQDQYTMSPFILKYLLKPHVYYCQQPLRFSERIFTRLVDADASNLWKTMRRSYSRTRLTRIDCENASYAKMIAANSCFSRENILRAYGADSYVSYLGVDSDIFHPLRLQRGGYVLSVGALSRLKGFDFIIRSLAQVRRTLRPPLIIVSNSDNQSMKSYLESLAARVGVDLSIKTFVSDSELVELYNGARLFLYAPYLEPFGLAPLEAMACGTPVIAVREGGVRESVIHDETGFLTERDEKEFSEAVNVLLLSEKKRRSLSAHARKVIMEFWTLPSAAKRLLRVLNRAKDTWKSAGL